MNTRKKVLVVDDTEENIDILVGVLHKKYDLRIAKDGSSATRISKREIPDLILLDITMPEMDGYDVIKELKKNKITREIPVIFLTALTQDKDETLGLSLGAVDYITKPFNPDIIKARVKNHLLLKEHQDNLEILVKKRTEQLELTQDVLIKSMGIIAEYRDPETGGHIKRTQKYMELLCNNLRNKDKYKNYLTESKIKLIIKSAPLHDLGKVKIPDNILLKPGKLNDKEFEEMKKHTIYGRNAIIAAKMELEGEDFLNFAEEIAYSHHEKWNGTGYPLGLKGEEISLAGRMMAIADVYDALISRRVYKSSLPHIKAVEIIKEGRGNHFEPKLVDVFMELEDKFREAALKFADYEEEKNNLNKI